MFLGIIHLLYLFSILSATIAYNPLASFISIGDWGGYNLGSVHQKNVMNVASQINNDVASNNYDGVLNTGDNFYYCGIQNLEDENIQADYISLFNDIDLTWYSSLGNHDYGYNVTAQLKLNQRIPNWYLPNNYYHTTITKSNVNIHIITLDTNPCVKEYVANDPSKWDPCGSMLPQCKPYAKPLPCRFHENILSQSCSQQYEWFVNTLTEIHSNAQADKKRKKYLRSSVPKTKVIVIGHHPINEVTMEPFIEVINSDMVDMYINGHVHMFGQYSVNGSEKYITNGAASMVSFMTHIDNNNYTWHSKTTGYMRHYIYEETIKNEFVNIEGDVIQSIEF